MNRPDDHPCAPFRERIHRTLDGELMDAALRAELDAHLAECPECQTAQRELLDVQSVLRSAPELIFSEEDLDAVFARTSRESLGRRVTRWGLDWRAAAAAAVLALGLWGAWPAAPVPEQVSQAELEQAMVEARWALQQTAEALRRSTSGAMDVIQHEVTPALQRVPVKLPGRPAERKSQT